MKKLLISGILSSYIKQDKYEIIKSDNKGYKIYNDILQYRPDFCIIHYNSLNGYYPLFRMILDRPNTKIIYVTPIMELGMLESFIDSPYFFVLDEKHIFAIEEIIYSMEKYIAKIELLANKLSEANYKLNEEKMVKKAKIILMKHKLSEDEAYKTILKIAMDLRISKLEAAKKILEKYDEK